MEFGSTLVYNYSDSEEETVSDDELKKGVDEDGLAFPVIGMSPVSSQHYDPFLC